MNIIQQAIGQFENGAVKWTTNYLAAKPVGGPGVLSPILVSTDTDDLSATHCCGIGAICRLAGALNSDELRFDVLQALDVAAWETQIVDESIHYDVRGGLFFEFNDNNAENFNDVKPVMERAAYLLDNPAELQSAVEKVSLPYGEAKH